MSTPDTSAEAHRRIAAEATQEARRHLAGVGVSLAKAGTHLWMGGLGDDLLARTDIAAGRLDTLLEALQRRLEAKQ